MLRCFPPGASQMLNKRSPSEAARALFICSFSILSLFFGFFTNYWRVADQQWFDNFQRDSESLIIGRMVKSRQNGIFSAGGLPGFGSVNAISAEYFDRPFSGCSSDICWTYQYLAYTKGLTFGAYTTYNSQIGGEGMFFGILDKSLTPLPQEKLRLFHALTSLLSAITLTAVILWFYLEFGLTVAFFVLTSAVFSQWLVVFGRNLYWSMWAFYLPVAVIMLYFKIRRTQMHVNPSALGGIIFVTVFIKCLVNGYEYITSAIVMMIVPFVYYSILKGLSFRSFLIGLSTAAFSTCLAILLSFLILCLQIGSVKGNVLDGVDHIAFALQQRTFAGLSQSGSTSSVKISTTHVVVTYLEGTFFDANNYLSCSYPFISKYILKVRYLYLIFIFMVMSGILYFFGNRHSDAKEKRKYLALICATWFSILAPLSWFIVFREHSYIHRHMNYVVWQMPFVFFGFAVCGLVAKSVLRDLIRLTRNSCRFLPESSW
jgi:hypothetical protein